MHGGDGAEQQDEERKHGPVALLSQSGASSSAMLGFASMVGVGMS
ncbi:hypothetical protein [Microbispora catharanthi]|nr:hypothetical protein [Microbispora catharanthi]